MPVASDVAMRALRAARKGAECGGRQRSPLQGSRERLGGCTAREELAVLADEVPGVEPRARFDRGEKTIALRALDRNGPEAPRAVPGEDLVQRPLAEGAVLVVEDDAVPVHRHLGAALGAGAVATERRAQETTTGHSTNTITTAVARPQQVRPIAR